jgi:predicted MFS family arabinose efflux permease
MALGFQWIDRGSILSQRVTWLVLTLGALSMALSFGIRTTFGVFVPVIGGELGWSVGGFALGWAVQNLLWGALQPIAGAIADTRGPRGVAFLGGIVYAAGLWLMALAPTPFVYGLGSGVLVGIALACGGMSVVLGAIMRASPPEKRGLYSGIVTAGGSLGQFVMLPATGAMIASQGWQTTLAILGVCAVGIAACALGLPRGGKAANQHVTGRTHGIAAALREALGDPSYLLLIAGFFVCGFHLAFIAFHLPQFAALCGLEPGAATDALALVGLFNAIGCVALGVLMNRAPSKFLLSGIYFLRAAVIAAFFLSPVTEISIRVFGAALGLLWLSTVAPTNGLVAKMFGTRYVTMLFGVVFFSHQVGGFIGAWLAGWLYDNTGSYDAIWWISVALGVFAGLVHLPIRERWKPTGAPA